MKTRGVDSDKFLPARAGPCPGPALALISTLVNLPGAYEKGRTGGVPPALPPQGSERLETGHEGPDRRAERVDRDTGIIAWSRTGYD